jgi:uncharacterized protein
MRFRRCGALMKLPLLVLIALGVVGFVVSGAVGGAGEVTTTKDPAVPNRLAREKSPYLRQHAFNPVDWFPWGSEAFDKARLENKPIFLSVGYSTCHWCHVMERESFSDPAIARLLNDNFVCIKVDREERPDVDRMYMNFLFSTKGSGGWPMSIWLTPDLKPFFGGTYFAPESSSGRPGFKAVISEIASQWKTSPSTLREESTLLFAKLAADAKSASPAEALPINELRHRAYAQLRKSFNKDHGGFESAPKFPQPVRLEFLLDVCATSPDLAQRDPALRMVLKTLREMIEGGIHDQLGGGFHRYSTDARWHVPHFEKMLYDQAQVASTCLTAWQLSADPVFKDAAEDTLAYVQDQMTDAGGGFYSAEDADSATTGNPDVHREGAFYVWMAAEIEAVLEPGDLSLFNFVYGVQPDGNAAHGSESELARQNVLFRAHTLKEAAAKFSLVEEALRSKLTRSSAALLKARAKRPRPLRDDKIITAWNGLMISAFARATQVIGDSKWAATAKQTAEFLRKNLYDPTTGRLARSYRAGVRDGRGFVEDYAFLIQGLLDLYETTFDVQWLEWALQLQEKQNELFWDPVAGGFFANTSDDASVLLRLKEDNDSAEPSPNSIVVRNLARLAGMLHRDEWYDLARRTARAFAPQIKRDPLVMPQMLASLGWLEGSPQQILIQGEPTSPDTQRLIAEVWQRFLPRHVLVRIDQGSRPFFDSRVPLVTELPRETEGPATAYVCENFVCQLPTHDPAVLAGLVTRSRRTAR